MYIWVLFTFVCKCVLEYVFTSFIVISIIDISFVLTLQVVGYLPICLHHKGMVLYNDPSLFLTLYDVVSI